ncbi:hypothetical protein BWI93_16590 [Siphonobacter sp. BAB-5385]|uniref:hypothetical protein n=1 Tax=Siphonobacter sp. BAB-5385 TaxID=1864822 RepID=UPI000B9ECB3E|nr:hypothetical protein [Siphonobacter sp. BAB-5385]OZI07076.1 hypothetical protein BWI93_16590 [Siphonobacter sp. BAB-5385]
MKSIVYASTSVLTVIAHWLCCLLPLLAAVLGLSGSSSVLSWVLDYRWYLVGFQVLLMSWSFYHLYVQHQPSPRLRYERAIFWFLLVFSVVAWSIPHEWLMSNDQKMATAQVQRVFNARKVTLALSDDTTPQMLEKSLENVDGVLQLKPVQAGVISLRYDFRKINKDQLLQDLRNQGLELTEVSYQ